jgi:hypothetical protein
MGAVGRRFQGFKDEKKLEKAPDDFDKVLQDKKLFKKYFNDYHEWAKKQQVANEIDFIRAVDNYKSNTTWPEAARIADVWLTSDSSEYANLEDFYLEDWIVRCCQAGQMLPG